MKLSRIESGADLIKKLAKVGYMVTRQKGSHVRLTREDAEKVHHITIPNHDPIKIGLLSGIINDVAKNLEMSKETLWEKLNQ
ncbi:MAG: type II toxin-antitoxin system HicA family toxin [Saprospiraceae bacterium]|nr:type II toxin-antitoxin system HicA family toxin [Saprospiraceae bacterium]